MMYPVYPLLKGKAEKGVKESERGLNIFKWGVGED